MRQIQAVRRISTGPLNGNGLTPALRALLPPIQLYRRLLRAHRNHLPKDMRLLGDEYIKAEFRAHRAAENPSHVVSCTGPLELVDTAAH